MAADLSPARNTPPPSGGSASPPPAGAPHAAASRSRRAPRALFHPASRARSRPRAPSDETSPDRAPADARPQRSTPRSPGTSAPLPHGTRATTSTNDPSLLTSLPRRKRRVSRRQRNRVNPNQLAVARSFRVVTNLWRSPRPAHKHSAARIVWCVRATPCSAIREENDESRHLGCAPRPRRRRLPRQPGRHGSLEDAGRPDPRRERDRLRAAAGDDHRYLVHRDRRRTDHRLWLCARRRLGRHHRSHLAYGRRRPVRGRWPDLAYDPDPDSDRPDAPHPPLRADGGDPGPLLAACPALVRVRRPRHIAAACEHLRHGAKTLMTLLELVVLIRSVALG